MQSLSLRYNKQHLTSSQNELKFQVLYCKLNAKVFQAGMNVYVFSRSPTGYRYRMKLLKAGLELLLKRKLMCTSITMSFFPFGRH